MIDIIPAIDILDGQIVRLRKGNFSSRIDYAHSALELAYYYQELGFKRLHVVDLSAARQGRLGNLDILAQLARSTSLQVDYGGGVRNEKDISLLFQAGVKQANIGSLAIIDPQLFIKLLSKFGPERIILAADVRGAEILTNAWENQSGQLLFEKLRYFSGANLRFLSVTDVNCDGCLSSPNLELYRLLRRDFPDLYLTASGGVGSLSDIESLQALGVQAVIVGRALLEGRIDLQKLGSYLC